MKKLMILMMVAALTLISGQAFACLTCPDAKLGVDVVIDVAEWCTITHDMNPVLNAWVGQDSTGDPSYDSGWPKINYGADVAMTVYCNGSIQLSFTYADGESAFLAYNGTETVGFTPQFAGETAGAAINVGPTTSAGQDVNVNMVLAEGSIYATPGVYEGGFTIVFTP